MREEHLDLFPSSPGRDVGVRARQFTNRLPGILVDQPDDRPHLGVGTVGLSRTRLTCGSRRLITLHAGLDGDVAVRQIVALGADEAVALPIVGEGIARQLAVGLCPAIENWDIGVTFRVRSQARNGAVP